MNANGMSYPAYHLGTQYFWNNIAERRRRPVAHVHHGHAVGAERALPGHGPRLGGREHRGEQRGDRAVRREPQERGHGRLRAAEREVQRRRSRRRTRCATTAPARRRAALGRERRPQLPQTPYVPAYTAAEQAQYSPVHPAGTAPEAQILSTEDDAAAFWNLGHPGLLGRRRPGLEHRREPVPVDDLRGDPGDAGPAVRGRRHGVRVRERRAGRRDDDARRRDGGRRHERQGRLG